MSGPLADRIDMHVAVGAVPLGDLRTVDRGEPSASVRARVVEARQRQRLRYTGMRAVSCNAHVPGRWLDAHSPIELAARTTLLEAAHALALSARGYHRVLKVSRTIADLDGAGPITAACVAEALRFRPAPATVEASSWSELGTGDQTTRACV